MRPGGGIKNDGFLLNSMTVSEVTELLYCTKSITTEKENGQKINKGEVMKVFCFDGDKGTESLFKGVFATVGVEVEKFMFNQRPEQCIHSSEDSDIVVFIDARMRYKRKNGFFLAMYFREKYPHCHIVFMSLYPEDMSHCFKHLIRPSAFLLKPLTATDISGIIMNIVNYEKRTAQSSVIHVSTREFKRSVNLNKILYFSTSGKKLCIKLVGGEEIEFYGTMASYESKCKNFIRCHSGFMVNKEYVKGIKRGEIEIVGCDETIPVSRKYKDIAMSLVKDN